MKDFKWSFGELLYDGKYIRLNMDVYCLEVIFGIIDWGFIC